jgi:DNA-binding transcriptional regulator YhcF (GntR family)
MFSDLDPKSAVPLYEQIAVRLKAAVATRLRINPATVVQAYRSLESDGFVEIRQGAGTYVRTMEGEARARERQAQARRLIRQLLADSARLGLSRQELKDAMKHQLEGSA